jgi:MinD-like ATPase involved in chromosome partitioning or flagellar assembly
LRRGDLEVFIDLLAKLGEARAVLLTGDAPDRREVAVCLAAAAAAGGTRTALLECDMAEPGLADALGLANAPGLGEYLLDAAKAEEILKPVVLAGPGSAGATEPLVCVVAGRPTSLDGVALLSSERFRHAVSGLRDSYELLVIDGPPPGREAELRATMASVEATLAVVGSAGERPSLPAPAAGMVVQRG